MNKPGFNKYSLVLVVVADMDLIENCARNTFPCTSPASDREYIGKKENENEKKITLILHPAIPFNSY
jgi:hypothetical protein